MRFRHDIRVLLNTSFFFYSVHSEWWKIYYFYFLQTKYIVYSVICDKCFIYKPWIIRHVFPARTILRKVSLYNNNNNINYKNKRSITIIVGNYFVRKSNFSEHNYFKNLKYRLKQGIKFCILYQTSVQDYGVGGGHTQSAPASLSI